MKQTIINRMYVDMLSGLKMSNKEYSEKYGVPKGTIRAYRNIAQMLFTIYQVDEAEMKKKDRTIGTQRNVIEQLISNANDDFFYGALAGVLGSTFIYFVILTYVLH